MKAFLNDPFSHEGRYFKIPPRSLCPKPVQQPHPPVFMVAQSPESHEVAASKGIGTLSWDMYMGWDYFETSYRLYRERIKGVKPVGGFVINSFGAVILNCVCAETKAEARRVAAVTFPRFVTPVIEELYPALGHRSKSYAYTLQLEKIRSKAGDLDWMLNETSCLAGEPNDFIERFRRYEAMGADEIILRLDGTHEEIKRTIRLIGEYVIPQFKTPKAIVTGFGPLAGPVP